MKKNNTLSLSLRKITSVNEFALFAILAGIMVFLSFTTEYFLTVRNLSNILGQVSMAAIASTGMVLVALTGEVDISIGSLQAFIALPFIWALNLTTNLPIAILVTLILGGVIGCFNGFLVTKLKINSLIATLGMYYILRGLVYVITGNTAISETSGKEAFFLLGNAKLFRIIPYSAIIMAAVLLVFGYILKNTRHGRNIYAVGGNSEVAEFIGINPARIKFISFVLSSILSSLAATILASRLGSANHLAGIGFEFKVIAATVLGGVSLAGGRGSLLGAFIGVLILGVLQNGMGMLGFNIMWEQITTGLIIIISVALDEYKRSR